MLTLAGPLSLVAVILSWACMQAVGFALIYWVRFPEDFTLPAGTRPTAQYGFATTLYFSFQVMTTLGLGDVLPKSDWLRFLVAFQALTGFALVTASLSWIILLYPALARMRTLARRTRTLLNAAEKTHIDLISGDVEYLLADLALDVIRVRVDFIHFPILYYFRSDDETSSLALALSELLRFAKAGSNPSTPERVRLAAGTLQEALDDTAELLREHFVRSGSESPERVFRAYARDHLTDLERED